MMAGKNYGSAKLDPSWTRKEKNKKKTGKSVDTAFVQK